MQTTQKKNNNKKSKHPIFLKSADPSGLRVDRPPFFQSLLFPILLLLILRTSFLAEPLILQALRAQGGFTSLLPPPWPRLGWLRLVPDDGFVSAIWKTLSVGPKLARVSGCASGPWRECSALSYGALYRHDSLRGWQAAQRIVAKYDRLLITIQHHPRITRWNKIILN